MTALLLFGLYPQAFYPQLSIIATSVPGNEMGALDIAGNRFLDSKRIEGTLPDMLDGAIAFARTNMRTATKIDPKTGKRIDVPQYPVIAVREAVLNAMKHANASEIAVSCVTAPDGNHTVYIRDNGIGIGEPKEPEGHYGLNIMRERAERLGGTLTFSQPSGGGTLVSISFRSAEGEESQLM